VIWLCYVEGLFVLVLVKLGVNLLDSLNMSCILKSETKNWTVKYVRTITIIKKSDTISWPAVTTKYYYTLLRVIIDPAQDRAIINHRVPTHSLLFTTNLLKSLKNISSIDCGYNSPLKLE